MARHADWKREIAEGTRKEHWSLLGPECIVKVLPLAAQPTRVFGFFTYGKYLQGLTPLEIEQDLGLKRDCMKHGARIYRFMRLPQYSEYEYELTTWYPDGQEFNRAHHDQNYLPGNRKYHQWRIKEETAIPVDEKHFLELLPGQRFPYDWLLK